MSEPNRTSEEGRAVSDAGPDGGEGKRWDTAELLPADDPFLQKVMHRKGSSAPFPRSADPFNDPFELPFYRQSLFQLHLNHIEKENTSPISPRRFLLMNTKFQSPASNESR